MAQFLGFGNGGDGDATLSGTHAPTDSTFTGSSGGASGTAQTGKSFSSNDIVILTQSRGSGAWELIQINTYTSGTGAVTFNSNLVNTYASPSQMIKVPQYSNIAISSSFTTKAWDGSVGGISVLMCSGQTLITSTFSANAVGYRGGSYPSQGEGYPGVGSDSPNANGNGGGNRADWSGGAGGGNGAAGQNGGYNAVSGAVTYGGSAVGSSDLSTMYYGGGGGSGSLPVTGGTGGGSIILITSDLICSSGYITANGANGGNGSGDQKSPSGGGAGGNILIKARTATIGTDRVQTSGGTGGGASSYSAGNGGGGRIRLETCTLSGSVSSSYYGSYSAPTGGHQFCAITHGIL